MSHDGRHVFDFADSSQRYSCCLDLSPPLVGLSIHPHGHEPGANRVGADVLARKLGCEQSYGALQGALAEGLGGHGEGRFPCSGYGAEGDEPAARFVDMVGKEAREGYEVIHAEVHLRL